MILDNQTIKLLVLLHVFFSRGRGTECNLGNIIYRELVSEFSEDYKKPDSTTLEKNKIAKLITSTIHDLGGLFFHQKRRNGKYVWEELPPQMLKKKVKQSLRDSKAIALITTETGESCLDDIDLNKRTYHQEDESAETLSVISSSAPDIEESEAAPDVFPENADDKEEQEEKEPTETATTNDYQASSDNLIQEEKSQ